MNVLRYGYSDGDGICRWSGGVIARYLVRRRMDGCTQVDSNRLDTLIIEEIR